MALPVTHQVDTKYSRQHPFEEAALEQRQSADIFTKLKDNQCLLTNLPAELEHWMSTPHLFKEHLLKTVHKDLEVQDVKYLHSVTTADQGLRYAYIVVSMGSKRQAHLVQKSLRQHWSGDNLLKVKLAADAKSENYDNRTVILHDLPTHMNQTQILEIFGNYTGSAVVGIEMPMENVAIAEYLEDRKLNSPLNPLTQEKARKFQMAQIAVKQSLEMDEEYISTINKELGDGVGDQIMQGDLMSSQNVIDQEKKKSLIRIVTRLQAEGAQVLGQKYELLEIRDNNNSHASVASAESLKDRIKQNKDSIYKVMQYLRENEESAPAVVKDPLDKLLELGQTELAHAYDTLIEALDEREKRIEKRIGRQLKHFGKDERILFEKRDYKFDLEDLPKPEMYRYTPEQVISINDQINWVLGDKDLSAEEKFSGIIHKQMNPFLKPLWNHEQLLLADESEFLPKQVEMFDVYRKSKSVIRMMREGAKFTKEAEKMVHDMVDEYKDNYTIAFDELYHREKGLIEAVVAADKALKEKEATFTSLVKSEELTKQEVSQLMRHSLIQDDSKDLFEKSQDRSEAKILQQNLMEDQAGNYEFAISKVQKLRQMVESGEINQSQYDNLLQVIREQETKNKGYCFLTFSHSDEARLMLLKNQQLHIDGRKVQCNLKANIDHAEMDFDFLMQRLKNDERTMKEVRNLRQARQELKDFESEMDGQMPNRKKLKEFRDLARNVIAGTTHTDNMVPNGRSDLDDEKLRAKVKEFEKKYPHVDLSQLFNTEKAEDARKSLHKNAFASYKAHEFLKHGINQDKQKMKARISDSKRRLQENDPYNFPELDETVKKVLSKDVLQPRIIDHGEQITKPGRRFNGYTDQEFIEAYFGKDMMRNHVTDREHDPLFLEQKSLKETYPVSKYLQMPLEEWKHKKIEELGWLPSAERYDADRRAVFSADYDLAKLQMQMDEGFNTGEYFMNKNHPTEKGRTLLDDMENTLQRYEKRKHVEDEPDNYDMREISKIRKHYADQYNLTKNYKPWINDLKEGKWDDSKVAEEDAEDVEGAEDEVQNAKFQSDYDDNLDPQARRVNAEYMAQYKQNKNLQDNGDPSKNQRAIADKELKTQFEIVQEQARSAHYKRAGHKYGGSWLRNVESGVETPREPTKVSGPGRSLDSFVNQEEDDIYEMYQRQINQRPEEEGPDSPTMKLNADLLEPDLPRFQEFMNDKAQGIHPFDKITDKVKESLSGQPKQTEAEQLQDRDLYQRELLGRMMGEKLTPRQYEIISGQYKQKDANLKHVKDIQGQMFFDKRQWIQLAQEEVEKIRRQKVRSGEWRDEESHTLLDQFIKQHYAQTPGPHAQTKFLRDMRTVQDAIQLLDNPERLLEKEYYFDETLGESLNEHCDNLKQEYPGMRVQARRDRDGFAIIKTLYDSSYKYDIDKLEAFDPQQAKEDQNHSMEAIFKHFLPSEQQVIDDVSENLQNTLSSIQGSNEPRYDLDAYTKLRVQALANQKFDGRIEIEDVVKQLEQISKEADYDQSKPLPQVDGTIYSEPQLNQNDDMLADRDRFRGEVYEQLMKRVKSHMFQTKRKDSDFVKPRVSEEQALRGQVLSHENALAGLENEVNEVDESNDNFDRNAFNKLKNEIKMRKAAKERLLNQGHAEFRPYLRL